MNENRYFESLAPTVRLKEVLKLFVICSLPHSSRTALSHSSSLSFLSFSFLICETGIVKVSA